MRSPSSPLLDVTVSPIFLPTVPERNPRMECFCQPLAFISLARVAPPGCRSNSRIVAVLLPSRTPSAFAFAAFGALGLAGVGFLLFEAGAGLAPFWLLAALFFGLAFFFEGAFSGATEAPCALTLASLVAFSVFSVIIFVFLLSR